MLTLSHTCSKALEMYNLTFQLALIYNLLAALFCLPLLMNNIYMASLIILLYFIWQYTKDSTEIKTFGAVYGLVRLKYVTGP